jgi:hypothetical protein
MTRVKTLTRVLDIESSLSRAKNAKRLESDSDESLTRPNTKRQVLAQFCIGLIGVSSFVFSGQVQDRGGQDAHEEDL